MPCRCRAPLGKIENFEIGRFLHLKFESRNLKFARSRTPDSPICDFDFKFVIPRPYGKIPRQLDDMVVDTREIHRV